MGPCHNGRVCPLVADGDGFQIWGHLWIYWISNCGKLTGGGPPAWVLAKGLTTPHHKKKLIMKCFTGPWNWMDSLDGLGNRKWIWDLEHGML